MATVFNMHTQVPLDTCQVESLILCAPISICGQQHNITHQPVVSTFSMHPGLQKKNVCRGGNAESCRKFPLPRPSCVHSRERRPDGRWVESAESQLGCMRGHFPLHFPGSLVRAGPGALSRTKVPMSRPLSGSQDPWANGSWVGSWQKIRG